MYELLRVESFSYNQQDAKYAIHAATRRLAKKTGGGDGRNRTMISQSCQAKEREGKKGEGLLVKEL